VPRASDARSNQAVVISFLGIFAFNYVFTQTLLATNPELANLR